MDKTDDTSAVAPPAGSNPRTERFVAVTLVLCACIVAFWQFMTVRARRTLDPFEMTASDFMSFSPRPADWMVRRLPVKSSRIEPNVLALLLQPRSARPSPTDVRVRLVHGYNMVDCMRIKGYTVTSLADTRQGIEVDKAQVQLPPGLVKGHQVQAWKLVSGAGDVSIALTGMLRSGDFRETSIDVRSMAFPRIGVPDDPSWMPEGFRLSSLRHPVRNIRLLMRAKWNNARCDLLTFLRLRPPAYVSDELFTLVIESASATLAPGDEPPALAALLNVYDAIRQELQDWRGAQVPTDADAAGAAP